MKQEIADKIVASILTLIFLIPVVIFETIVLLVNIFGAVIISLFNTIKLVFFRPNTLYKEFMQSIKIGRKLNDTFK